MDGIQVFKKANFCVKNLANRLAIRYIFVLNLTFLIHLATYPELIEIPLIKDEYLNIVLNISVIY